MRRKDWIAVGLSPLLSACNAEPRSESAGPGAGNPTSSTGTTTGTGTGNGPSADSTPADGPTTAAASSTSGADAGNIFDVANIDDLGNGTMQERTCEEAARSLTSAGCSFAPLALQTTANQPWAVVAANTGLEDATVTLSGVDSREIESAVIAPGALHTFILAAQSAVLTQHLVPTQASIGPRALRLESDIPIAAYQFSPYSASEQASADASLLLPRHAWGNDHVVGSYQNDSLSETSLVIASLDRANVVEVTISTYLVGTARVDTGDGIEELTAGDSRSFTLDDGDVVTVTSRGNAVGDLTGTQVTSAQAIAVFTSTTGIGIPDMTAAHADHIEQQLPPRAAWGSRYAVVPFRPRGGEEDIFRFVADADGTVIELTGDYEELLELDEAEFAEVRTSEAFFAESEGAFAVFHFMQSHSEVVDPIDPEVYPGNYLSPHCDLEDPDRWVSDLGDPALTFVPPLDQFRFSYGFLTPETFAWDMVTVVAATDGWNSIELDGSPLPAEPTPLGVGGLGYARFIVEDGPHQMSSPTTEFGLEVYGYDCRVSYAFPGGLSLLEINPAG